jgi:hypothetical protein
MPGTFFQFKTIPRSAISQTTLSICLHCAYDFFIEELHLSPDEAYRELQEHTPEPADFSGAATARPHFFHDVRRRNCPFCRASSKYFAAFRAYRVYAHCIYEKARTRVWARLEADTERFALLGTELTKREIFSLWLDDLKHHVGFHNPRWWFETVAATIGFFYPSHNWDEVSPKAIHKITCKSSLKAGDWHYKEGWLQLSPALYGGALIVDRLISRGLPEGLRKAERQPLGLADFCRRLDRLGYLQELDDQTVTPQEAFEQAVESLVASGPQAVYYAVDRADYLKRLNIIYQQYTD